MSVIKPVAEYPQEGFAVLEDDKGKFLVFKDQEKILPIDYPPETELYFGLKTDQIRKPTIRV